MEALRLHDAVVFLAAAGLIVPLFKRMRFSPILGFLVVGLLIGPYGLARFVDQLPWLSTVLITDVEGVTALAELGVVFLLFMIGLELSFERLWAMRRLVFGLGSAQVLVTAAAIGLVAWLFGNPIAVAILLGACLALSSTAIVIQLLVEQGRFGSSVGRAAFAILLAQDIAVVPILFIASAFGAQTDAGLGASLAMAFGKAFLAVALIVVIGRLVVRRLFRFVASAESTELFMAATLLSIVATAAATHAAGLSAALGAFLAGLVLAECDYRHEIELNIEPFKGLLLGLFFVSVAMGIDLAQIAAQPGWVLLSVVGLLAMKATVMAGLALTFGFRWRTAWEVGLLLGQGGEFAFVVLGLALSLQLLPASTAQFMLIVVGATMLLTPAVAGLARRLQGGDHPIDDGTDLLAPDLAGHVVVVGYGRTGRLLAEFLNQQKLAYVGLDLDVDRVAALRAKDVPILLGDASRAQMLRKVNLPEAAALVICTDDPGATERVLETAAQVAPGVPVLARARDEQHAAALLASGATGVVPEVFESGLQLAHLLLLAVGLPASAARDAVEVRRADSEAALDALAR